MLQGWDTSWTVRRIDAAAAVDGTGGSTAHRSGVSALLERRPDGTITLAALGPTDQIATTTRWPNVQVIDRRDCLLIPGLVNAHTHLDLTHIGPRPHHPETGFAPWIDMIRRERLSDPPAIASAVCKGVALSLAGGTVLVGDIAGAVGGRPSTIAGRALAETGLVNAVTFMEFFARGANADKLVESAASNVKGLADEFASRSGARVVSGVQPHAIYSVLPSMYEKVLACLPDGTPACSHVAESLAERRFTAEATGPFVDLLRSLNLWNDADPPMALGESPIDVLTSALGKRLIAAVHVNDASDRDLSNLKAAGWPVTYCPRASAYFAAERDFGPHRYRDMLAAGITVALGTDSIVNLDTPDRISVWDEMCLLAQRDATDPVTLLSMGTHDGALALWRDPALFAFTQMGKLAGLAAIHLTNPNTRADPTELLRGAMIEKKGGMNTIPELIAIGRI